MPYTVRYTDGFLMHFGVGHLNGGHSGRYPWGSGRLQRTASTYLDLTANSSKAELSAKRQQNTGATKKRLDDYISMISSDASLYKTELRKYKYTDAEVKDILSDYNELVSNNKKYFELELNNTNPDDDSLIKSRNDNAIEIYKRHTARTRHLETKR